MGERFRIRADAPERKNLVEAGSEVVEQRVEHVPKKMIAMAILPEFAQNAVTKGRGKIISSEEVEKLGITTLGRFEEGMVYLLVLEEEVSTLKNEINFEIDVLGSVDEQSRMK